MKISTRGNIPVTKALSNYIHEKLSERLEDFSETVERIEVKLTVEKGSGNRHLVEVLTVLRGQRNSRIYKNSAEADDMYDAINAVADGVYRQAVKRKERRLRPKNYRDELEPSTPAATERSNEHEVVKTKTFVMKPMSIDEAILRMLQLGHSFFMYMDASSGLISTVYIRKDGKYGIIEASL